MWFFVIIGLCREIKSEGGFDAAKGVILLPF
jgi:hypothetical protein